MRYRSSLAALFLALAAALLLAACGGSKKKTPPETWHVLRGPISRAQLTNMPWGESSYWLQPWRSSLVTRPVTALENAIGINFDVLPQEAMATARLMRASGIRRARLEISWNHMSYADPGVLTDQSSWSQYIVALRDYGIRPLILLNGDPAGPTPLLTLNLTLTAPAAEGTRNVSLSPASAAQVVPGRTGIDVDGYVAKVMITSVDRAGQATLSQPLPQSFPAGQVAAATFRFEPFAAPYLANGRLNPRFKATLVGWLAYAKTVCQFVARVYGSDNFDVEVWNENQAFLDESTYFNPVPDPGGKGSTTYTVLRATIHMLRNPANGLTAIRVGDGFSNQSPFTSGTTVPPGTAAIDHHPYAQDVYVRPGAAVEAGVRPVNPAGEPARFTPSFLAFFPEYYLSGIPTETLMRDLSPTIRSNIDGTIHGATTHPPGSPPPAIWITEDNLDQDVAKSNGMPAADIPEMQAKAALRFYVSYASEGAQAIDLFAAEGGSCCQIIPQAFFSAVDARPGSYPVNLEGPTMRAVGRLTSLLSGAQPIARPQQLTLKAIAQLGNHSQFTGNGTSAYPDLYDRDVLTFFPFQASQKRFVAAVYVMTRDVTQRYTSDPAPGQTPFDLPAEQFRLTIGNVDGAHARVSLYDPLIGGREPARIISRTRSQIVVQLAATDSPRMLTIDDGGPA